MITRMSPTSFGLFSNRGSICFKLAFPVSHFAWAAALRTERVLIAEEVVGEGDSVMIDAVENATP